MIKILIIGSNFGSKIYLRALSKMNNNIQIFICSPNIHKKKIEKKVIKYSSYKIAMLENNFDYVICATTPLIQYKVLCFIKKNKCFYRGILLEKPISSTLNKTKRSINILEKLKIPFLTNFIFSELDVYKEFKKMIKKKHVREIEYTWEFQQAYFRNKIPTWKTNDKLGGGMLKYYGIHVFYHLVDLLNLDENTKFKIEDITYLKKKTTYLKIVFLMKNINLMVKMNINSKNNFHSINFNNRHSDIKLFNNYKDWTTGFKILKNSKILNSKKENRIQLTKKVISRLISNYENKKNKTDTKYVKKILVAHILCEKIFNKSKMFI